MRIHGFISYRDHQSWLQKDLIPALRNESGFISYRGSRILNVFKRFVSWICFVDWFSKMNPRNKYTKRIFQKWSTKQIQETNLLKPVFSRILTNPDKSLVHRRTLNKPESIRILGFGFANPYWFQKICFVDSFCRPFLKDSFRGLVSWIHFWKIHFVDSFR